MLFGDLKPGQTPIPNFSGLKIQGITTLPELDFHEARNVFNAIAVYLQRVGRKRIEFDLESVKAVHRDMFCDVWEWAGQFRTCDLNIGCGWTQIQEKLYVLLEDTKVWSDHSSDLFEQASWLHHRLVQIHPFNNGNGRWSRLVTNMWLLEKQVGIIEWPSEIGDSSPVRNAYLKALESADDGEYHLLVELHSRFIPKPRSPVIVRPPDESWMPDPGTGNHSGNATRAAR